jgi:hypothetical protein
MHIILGLILFLLLLGMIGTAIKNCNPEYKAMTKEQQLQHDIAQLSPAWQKTIEGFNRRMNNIDC